MKNKLGMMGPMAGILAMGEMGYTESNKGDNDLKPKDIDITPKKLPIPKGCKEYFFNKNGGYNTERDIYTVFTCVAISYKSAKRKFKNFIRNNN